MYLEIYFIWPKLNKISVIRIFTIDEKNNFYCVIPYPSLIVTNTSQLFFFLFLVGGGDMFYLITHSPAE